MSRYDYESDITFAQQQFDEARRRGEKTGKRIAREAIKQQFVGGLIGVGVKSFKSFLDQKADALHASQSPQKAAYVSWNTRANNLKTGETDRIARKLSYRDYLAEQALPTYMAKLKIEEPNLPDATLKKYALQDAYTMIDSTGQIESYKKMLDSAMSLPSFKDTDAFEEFYKNNAKPPRTIVGWLSQEISKRINRENTDTIEYKSKKADALYGTGHYKKYKTFENDLAIFDAINAGGYEVSKTIDRIKKDNRYNPAFDESKMKFKTETSYNIKTDEVTTRELAVFPTIGLDGLPVVKTEIVTENTKPNTDNIASREDISKMAEWLVPTYKNKDGSTINVHQELLKIIDRDSGIVTKTSIQKGWDFIFNNPQYYAPDFQEETQKEELFTIYKNNMLKFNGSEKGKSYTVPLSSTSDVWKVRDDAESIQWAKKNGLDDESLRESFESSLQKGLTYTDKGEKEYMLKEWERNKISFNNAGNTEEQKQQFKVMNEALYENFKNEINESQEDIVELNQGKIIDFVKLGIPGTPDILKSNKLYFNKQNSTFYYQ